MRSLPEGISQISLKERARTACKSSNHTYRVVILPVDYFGKSHFLGGNWEKEEEEPRQTIFNPGSAIIYGNFGMKLSLYSGLKREMLISSAICLHFYLVPLSLLFVIFWTLTLSKKYTGWA